MIDLTKRMALRPPEIAEVCGCSLPTVYAWIHRQEDPLPTFREGRAMYVPIITLEKWLQRQAEQETA